MSFIAIAVSSVFFACKKQSIETIQDEVNVNSANQKVMVPPATMTIGPGAGTPYLVGPSLMVYTDYCDAYKRINAYGEVRTYVASLPGYVPESGYQNLTPSSFSMKGYCTIGTTSNPNECIFNTGFAIGSWGPYYYLRSTTSAVGHAKILRVRFKKGATSNSFAVNGSPTFFFNHATNSWNNFILPINASFIDAYEYNGTSAPYCYIADET